MRGGVRCEIFLRAIEVVVFLFLNLELLYVDHVLVRQSAVNSLKDSLRQVFIAAISFSTSAFVFALEQWKYPYMDG